MFYESGEGQHAENVLQVRLWKVLVLKLLSPYDSPDAQGLTCTGSLRPMLMLKIFDMACGFYCYTWNVAMFQTNLKHIQ